jgi:hypothetical protein
MTGGTIADGQARELKVIELLQAPLARELRGRQLDRPKSSTSGRSLEFLGWVMPKAGAIARVEVVANDGLVATTALNHLRPDLASAFPDVPDAEHAGFRVVVALDRAPKNGHVHVRAVLENGVHVPVASVLVREANQLEETAAQDEAASRGVTPDQTRFGRWLRWRRPADETERAG